MFHFVTLILRGENMESMWNFCDLLFCVFVFHNCSLFEKSSDLFEILLFLLLFWANIYF